MPAVPLLLFQLLLLLPTASVWSRGWAAPQLQRPHERRPPDAAAPTAAAFAADADTIVELLLPALTHLCCHLRPRSDFIAVICTRDIMECIRKYDIELEKEVYYGGETLKGCVVIENVENLRVNSVQVFLRGKAHVEWRVTRAGERRTVKEDQFFVDEKTVVWGREPGTGVGGIHHWEAAAAGSDASACDNNLSPSGQLIMSSGEHRFSFAFQLPEGRLLPGSFESRHGAVRYYVRVLIDVPYASPLQGLKYFTVVGPLIDRLDARYNTPLAGRQQTTEKSCLCCTSGHVLLEVLLERGSYCCGERIRVKCDIQNASSRSVTLVCRLIQTVEYRINKGISGLIKVVTHQALEWYGPTVHRQSAKIVSDADDELRVPVMPPTTTGICDPINISYAFQVSLTSDKQGGEMQVEFPIVIVTVPHRTLNSQTAELIYQPAAGHVEGGIYVSPEFLLGQVYDGAVLDDAAEVTILYRPVYVCVQTPDGSTTQATPSSVVRSADIRGSSSAVPDVELSTTSSRSLSLGDDRRPDNDDSSDKLCHGVTAAADDGGGIGIHQSHTSSPRSSKTPIGQNGTATCLPQHHHNTPLSSPSKLSVRLLPNSDDADSSSPMTTTTTTLMTRKSNDEMVASTSSVVKETDNDGVPMVMTTTTVLAAAAAAAAAAKSDGLVQKYPVISEKKLEKCDNIIGSAENELSESTIVGDKPSSCRSKPVKPSFECEDTGRQVESTTAKQNCRPDQLVGLLSTTASDRCCVFED